MKVDGEIMTIELPSGRIIGVDLPTFIICEVGSNWSTLDDCLHSIAMAKQCGADAVKFQLFDEPALYGFHLLKDATDPNCEIPFIQLESRGSFDPRPGQMPREWLPRLKEKADGVGIEFMCSAFSPELIDAVDPYVNIHKVASAELAHVRMLERLREIGKPVILSTGASGIEDIRMAVKVLGATPTVLMYCVAAYPARGTNLRAIDDLSYKFPGVPIGFSDHSLNYLTIPIEACEMGTVVLEKHFTAFPDLNTPDKDHSLLPDEFREMVNAIRLRLPPYEGYTKEETPMILRHNRRLIATRDIKPGEVLRENQNFGIYRSLKDDTHAFSPWIINDVNGKISLREIKAGDGIGPGDI